MAALRGFTGCREFRPAVGTRTSPCSALNARPLTATAAGDGVHYQVKTADSTAIVKRQLGWRPTVMGHREALRSGGLARFHWLIVNVGPAVGGQNLAL
jgi:hypothetical protein